MRLLSMLTRLLSGRNNNWPPLPEKFPVGPCFYHDIAVDIPVEFQKTVKIMYYLWMREWPPALHLCWIDVCDVLTVQTVCNSIIIIINQRSSSWNTCSDPLIKHQRAVLYP